MKRKLNISTYTAFAAALALLITEVYAGGLAKKQSDIVNTAASAAEVIITVEAATTANGSDLAP